MRTSLLLAYKSVRTLRRAGLDYATPAPLASQCSWWRPRRETRPFLPASPAAVAEPPRARSAPGLRLSHFRLAPRNSTRLARGPKGSWGAARWHRRVGEGWREKWRRGIWFFAAPPSHAPATRLASLAGVAGRACHCRYVENGAGRPAEELGRTPVGMISIYVTLHIISHLSCFRRVSQITYASWKMNPNPPAESRWLCVPT